MSQTYTDECFAGTHQGQTDLTSFYNNFKALKSAFSGTSPPDTPVPGMWWLDTTNHILKIYSESSTWLSVWDFANNKPVITNLSNEITSAMLNSALKEPAAAVAGLRTLGTGALQALPGNTSFHIGAALYTSGSGYWSRPTGVSYALVMCTGGGGGGGGGAFTSEPAATYIGGNGGNGGKVMSLVDVSGAASWAYSVGAAGSGGNAGGDGGQGTNGTSGGNTSFGTTVVVANGGTYGTYGKASPPEYSGTNGTAGSTSTTATNLLHYLMTLLGVGGTGAVGAGSAGTSGAVLILWVEP